MELVFIVVNHFQYFQPILLYFRKIHSRTNKYRGQKKKRKFSPYTGFSRVLHTLENRFADFLNRTIRFFFFLSTNFHIIWKVFKTNKNLVFSLKNSIYRNPVCLKTICDRVDTKAKIINSFAPRVQMLFSTKREKKRNIFRDVLSCSSLSRLLLIFILLSLRFIIGLSLVITYFFFYFIQYRTSIILRV